MATSAGKRRSVTAQERKSATLIVRVRPTVKQRLEELSNAMGVTMSALVEHAIMKMRTRAEVDSPQRESDER